LFAPRPGQGDPLALEWTRGKPGQVSRQPDSRTNHCDGRTVQASPGHGSRQVLHGRGHLALAAGRARLDGRCWRLGVEAICQQTLAELGQGRQTHQADQAAITLGQPGKIEIQVPGLAVMAGNHLKRGSKAAMRDGNARIGWDGDS